MDIKKLKETRRRKKITFPELANLSNVPVRTLENIFSGRTPHPRIDTMQAIERALGLIDGGSPLDNAKVEQTLTEKEQRLLSAFNALIEPMQDIMLEQIEKLAEIKNGHRKQA